MANRVKTWGNEVLTAADLNAEFDNIAVSGTVSRTGGRFGSDDNIQFTCGSSQDAILEWNTDQTQDQLILGLSGSNNFSIMSKGDESTDWGIGASTNPTLFVHSIDETSTTDYISFTHDQTDGVMNIGSGALKVKFAGTLKARIGSSGEYRAGDGTVSLPGLAFVDDFDNGWYRIGVDNWAGAAGGVKLIEFNESPGSGEASTIITQTADQNEIPLRVTGLSNGLDNVQDWYRDTAELASLNGTNRRFDIASADMGNDIAGPTVRVGRNSNATNPGPGQLVLTKANGSLMYLWVDSTGDLRIDTSQPVGTTADSAGTIVGTQS